MKIILPLITLAVASMTGCSHVQTAQKSGSEFVSNGGESPRFVTYVSQEEYERMTVEERRRTNAQVGAEIRIPLNGASDAKPITREQFDKTMADAARADREK